MDNLYVRSLPEIPIVTSVHPSHLHVSQEGVLTSLRSKQVGVVLTDVLGLAHTHE